MYNFQTKTDLTFKNQQALFFLQFFHVYTKSTINEICFRKHFYCIDTLGIFVKQNRCFPNVFFSWKISWQAQSISFLSGKTGIAISVRYLEFLGTTSKANFPHCKVYTVLNKTRKKKEFNNWAQNTKLKQKCSFRRKDDE